MLFRLTMVLMLILCCACVLSQTNPSNGYQCTGGVYYTFEDFKKGNITDLGILMTPVPNNIIDADPKEIVFSKPDSTMTIGPQEYRFKVKENKIWGFRATDGNMYRIDPETHHIYNLIISGPLYLWARGSHIGRDKHGNVEWIHILYKLDFFKEGFSKHFYISQGPNGELISCNTKNLLVFFRDDEVLLNEIKLHPIKEKDEQTLESSMSNLMRWVEIRNRNSR